MGNTKEEKLELLDQAHQDRICRSFDELCSNAQRYIRETLRGGFGENLFLGKWEQALQGVRRDVKALLPDKEA